jgi:CBS domain-containing protein
MIEALRRTAGEVMTREVVCVDPETSCREAARLLASKSITGMPVVDRSGQVVGMVTEADLIRQPDQHADEIGAWWLDMLADGFDLAPDFLEHVRSSRNQVRGVMTSQVLSVGENAPLGEVARLLEQHRVKRVVVLRDGALVGVVSRADLVRAMAAADSDASGPHVAA